ncbi:MAG: hypothetical protein HY343_10175 [Lentisphaerae bacterium]|nr:hypothetical protein [Lentisphaerota bacterium]
MKTHRTKFPEKTQNARTRTAGADYLLESREDEIYHDIVIDRLGAEPEYYAFVGKVWEFNRAMEWRLLENDTLLCYCKGGDLPLTGIHQVSTWHTEPANRIDNREQETRFVKKSANRRKDCAVLPAFQFAVAQHPEAELTVGAAAAEWQFCVLIKGRSGPPLLSSGWQKGEAVMQFNLAEALRRKGYRLHYAELHFALGVRSLAAEAAVTFTLRLLARPAIIPCLPVIRTLHASRSEGVPIAAVVLNEKGERQSGREVGVAAAIDGRKEQPLDEHDGVWTTRLTGLSEGDYEVKLTAKGAVRKSTMLSVRVTDGNFISYAKPHKSAARNGRITGPLSGSFQGMLYFRDVGKKTERMINGQKAWDSLGSRPEPVRDVGPDREIGDSRPVRGARGQYWEALTEQELDERFAYLHRCGWSLLHLCQHWGVWERLDAGGRIAPHGAEQLALYLRVAGRHGLAVLFALTHYPYIEAGSLGQTRRWAGTPPFSRYLDEGFKNEDWKNPDSHFTGLFHEYLRHFTLLFKDETALFALSTSGEGDKEAGPGRVNDTCDFVASLDKRHLFVAEPIFRLDKFPAEYCKGWKPEPAGSRSYWIGEDIKPEVDLGLEYKVMQLGEVFMGEFCWSYPPFYAAFQNKVGGHYACRRTWTGTQRYRNRLRDTLYLGLVHRCPFILSWDEAVAEDERVIFDRVRQQVDWAQPFMNPKVALRVDGGNLSGEGRKNLARYEEYFMHVPLSYRLLPPGSGRPDGVIAEIDARNPFQAPAFASAGGRLPDSLKDDLPLEIAEGYGASYLWSDDRHTLLAYVFNTTRWHMLPPLPLAGAIHRMPEAADLNVTISNLADRDHACFLYDLNGKILAKKTKLRRSGNLNIGATDKDYFLLIRPA